jgi:hypothetical protein
MRAVLLLALLLSPHLVGAQEAVSANHSQWLVQYTRPYAVELGLNDLAAPPNGALRELRLWTGFGLTGVALLVLHETAKGWAGTEYYPVGQARAPRRRPVPADSAAKLWRAAVGAGLLALPAEPQRPPSDLVVDDGYSVLIEWTDSARTGSSAAAHPDVFCSPDDQRILAVVRALMDPYVPKCVTR